MPPFGPIPASQAGNNFYYCVGLNKDGNRTCERESERMDLCGGLRSAAAETSSGGATFSVHAYCVDDMALRAVIETSDPHGFAGLLRRLGRRRSTARASKRQERAYGPVFDECVWAQIHLSSEMLAAVRHTHLAPVYAGLVRDAADWRPSSHRSYLQLESSPGLTRGFVASLLASGPGGWPPMYRSLMRESKEEASLICVGELKVPILPKPDRRGDRGAIGWLRRQQLERERSSAFEQTVDEVCRATGCDPERFRANPSSSHFQRERALVVVRLTREKAIPVKDVARRLGCDRSWIYRTMRRYRLAEPPERT